MLNGQCLQLDAVSDSRQSRVNAACLSPLGADKHAEITD